MWGKPPTLCRKIVCVRKTTYFVQLKSRRVVCVRKTTYFVPQDSLCEENHLFCVTKSRKVVCVRKTAYFVPQNSLCEENHLFCATKTKEKKQASTPAPWPLPLNKTHWSLPSPQLDQVHHWLIKVKRSSSIIGIICAIKIALSCAWTQKSKFF